MAAKERMGPLLSFSTFPWAWERAGFPSNYPVSFLTFLGLASLSYPIFFPDFPRVVTFMVAILTPTMYVLIVPSGLLLCSMHPIKVLPLEVFRNYYKGHMDKNKG